MRSTLLRPGLLLVSSILTFAILAQSACTSPRDASPSSALAVSYRIYDGHTGRVASLDEVLARAADADVVYFGEHHYQLVCNAVSAELLQGLLAADRPIALAMEFFTRDDQEALDAYLRGNLSEADFQEATGKEGKYLLSHRPLIEQTRRPGSTVIGAGIERSKWSLWRESGLDDYAEWLATLAEEERSSFPRECVRIKDSYWNAIKAFNHGQPESKEEPTEEERTEIETRKWASFKTQSMWDDSFAEAMADARAENPDRQVMLVVGAFHIRHGLGTVTKYRLRRPDDRIVTLSMSPNNRTGYDLAFNEQDMGLADYVLYTVQPPPQAPPKPAVAEEEDVEKATEAEEAKTRHRLRERPR